MDDRQADRCINKTTADSLFDMLPAGYRVPHASSGEPLYILHNDERFLLQGDNGQVVVVKLSVTKGVEARPHWVFQCQAAVVQFAHLVDRRGRWKKKL